MSEKTIKAAEEYIKRTGDYGLIPLSVDQMRSLTGLRHKIAIEKKLGRRISDAEWENMSIR